MGGKQGEGDINESNRTERNRPAGMSHDPASGQLGPNPPIQVVSFLVNKVWCGPNNKITKKEIGH